MKYILLLLALFALASVKAQTSKNTKKIETKSLKKENQKAAQNKKSEATNVSEEQSKYPMTISRKAGGKQVIHKPNASKQITRQQKINSLEGKIATLKEDPIGNKKEIEEKEKTLKELKNSK